MCNCDSTPDITLMRIIGIDLKYNGKIPKIEQLQIPKNTFKWFSNVRNIDLGTNIGNLEQIEPKISRGLDVGNIPLVGD